MPPVREALHGVRPPASAPLPGRAAAHAGGGAGVLAAAGGLPVVRAALGAGPVGGWQEPADEVVRLVPGALGEAAPLEQGCRDFRLRLAPGVRGRPPGRGLGAGTP